MLYRVLGMIEPSPSEWTIIIWGIVVISLLGGSVTSDPNLRVLCLVIGVGTLVGRIAVNRFVN